MAIETHVLLPISD